MPVTILRAKIFKNIVKQLKKRYKLTSEKSTFIDAPTKDYLNKASK